MINNYRQWVKTNRLKYYNGGHLFNGITENTQLMKIDWDAMKKEVTSLPEMVSDNTQILIKPITELFPETDEEKQAVANWRKMHLPEKEILGRLYSFRSARSLPQAEIKLGYPTISETYKKNKALTEDRYTAASYTASDLNIPFELVANYVDLNDPTLGYLIGLNIKKGVDYGILASTALFPEVAAPVFTGYLFGTSIWEAARGNYGSAALRAAMAVLPGVVSETSKGIASVLGTTVLEVEPWLHAGIGTSMAAPAIENIVNKEGTSEDYATLGLIGMPFMKYGINKSAPYVENLFNNLVESINKSPNFNFENIEATEWYKDVVSKVGLENANKVIDLIKTPEFKQFFFGENPKVTLEELKLYELARDVISKLTGDVNLGKGALAGSAAISKEGTLTRSSAVPHDIDMNVYIDNASKQPVSEFDAKYLRNDILAAREIRKEVLNQENIENAPIIQILREQYPETFSNVQVRTMTPFDITRARVRGRLDKTYSWIPDLLKDIVYQPYKDGVVEINPLINRSDAGTNRFAKTRVNGLDVDLFFSDAFLPLTQGNNTLSAENSLAWKNHFILTLLNNGRTPRAKDLADLENFKYYSLENPIIDPITGEWLYSPYNFSGTQLLTSENLPYMGMVETYPGSGNFIPTFMNTKGEFKIVPTESLNSRIRLRRRADRFDFDHDSEKSILELILEALANDKIDNQLIEHIYKTAKRANVDSDLLKLLKDKRDEIIRNDILNNKDYRSVRRFCLTKLLEGVSLDPEILEHLINTYKSSFSENLINILGNSYDPITGIWNRDPTVITKLANSDKKTLLEFYKLLRSNHVEEDGDFSLLISKHPEYLLLILNGTFVGHHDAMTHNRLGEANTLIERARQSMIALGDVGRVFLDTFGRLFSPNSVIINLKGLTKEINNRIKKHSLPVLLDFTGTGGLNKLGKIKVPLEDGTFTAYMLAYTKELKELAIKNMREGILGSKLIDLESGLPLTNELLLKDSYGIYLPSLEELINDKYQTIEEALESIKIAYLEMMDAYNKLIKEFPNIFSEEDRLTIDPEDFYIYKSPVNEFSDVTSKIPTIIGPIYRAKLSEGGKLNVSSSDIERNNINMLKYTGNLPLVRYDNGGKLWKDLSMKERALLIRNHVRNTFANGGSITDINIEDIRNKYDEGGHYNVGNLVDAIYESPNIREELPELEPLDHYLNTISEEEAERLGYYKDVRGHRDDRVKLPSHPSHPSRGYWGPETNAEGAGLYYHLSDKGMEDPNYTMFGFTDGDQDPLATLLYNNSIVLPEITVTPKGNYIHDTYNDIKIHLRNNGGTLIHLYDEGGKTNEEAGYKGEDMVITPLQNPDYEGYNLMFNQMQQWHLNNITNNKHRFQQNVIKDITGDLEEIYEGSYNDESNEFDYRSFLHGRKLKKKYDSLRALGKSNWEISQMLTPDRNYVLESNKDKAFNSVSEANDWLLRYLQSLYSLPLALNRQLQNYEDAQNIIKDATVEWESMENPAIGGYVEYDMDLNKYYPKIKMNSNSTSNIKKSIFGHEMQHLTLPFKGIERSDISTPYLRKNEETDARITLAKYKWGIEGLVTPELILKLRELYGDEDLFNLFKLYDDDYILADHFNANFAYGGKLFDDGGQEETIPEWITKSKLDTMYSNSALRSYLAKYWASKKWTDEDIDYFYDKLINNETKWDPRTIVYAMAHESSFNPKANPGTTSASGLGLLTKDTVKTLYPDTWEEVWDLYSNNNRSIKDLLDDAFANYARIGNAISKDTDLMGYGRLKVNLLSPSKGLDDIVPDYMWDLGSLTKALQKQLVKGKSTYRDLMNMYNKEFLNYWDNDYRNPDYDPVNSDNPLQLPWYNVLWDNIKTQFGWEPPEGRYDFYQGGHLISQYRR